MQQLRMGSVQERNSFADQWACEINRSTGKVGSKSSAARFAAATASDFTIQDDKPYAEVSANIATDIWTMDPDNV
jgi:hypothetical protein